MLNWTVYLLKHALNTPPKTVVYKQDCFKILQMSGFVVFVPLWFLVY